MNEHTGPSEVLAAVPGPMPEEVADVIAKRNAKVAQIGEIDAELNRLDKLIEEYAATLGEMRDTHAAKGRERTELARAVARLERMAEAGAAADGIQLPAAGQPAPVLPPSVSTGPAAAIDNALNSGPLTVLGDPAVTRVDDPDGGDEPAQGPFHHGNGRAR